VNHLRFHHGFLLTLCLALAVCLGAQDTTVVLLRHAERLSRLDGDSPLAEAGFHRAQALVPLLASFQPKALYVSDLQRTQQTLAPTAAKLGLKPIVRPKGGSADLAAEILRSHRGETVLVCWHHDLIKQIVQGLGVKRAIPHWPGDAYDWLWIVHIPAEGEATLEERLQWAPAGGSTRISLLQLEPAA
jgi:phosphohistidine phosphatase SixA